MEPDLEGRSLDAGGERGVWTRRDKSARGLRYFQGCIEAGISIEDVAEHVVYDERSHEVVADVGVRGHSGRDPSFTAKLDGQGHDNKTNVPYGNASQEASFMLVFRYAW